MPSPVGASVQPDHSLLLFAYILKVYIMTDEKVMDGQSAYSIPILSLLPFPYHHFFYSSFASSSVKVNCLRSLFPWTIKSWFQGENNNNNKKKNQNTESANEGCCQKFCRTESDLHWN